jgi:hypothetical protein
MTGAKKGFYDRTLGDGLVTDITGGLANKAVGTGGTGARAGEGAERMSTY